MDLQDLYTRLGGEPTVTFGCVNPPEIVGPMKPRSVQYGITYGNDPETMDVFAGHALPTVWLNFNKYRPDLPPWRNVVEFVLAAENDGDIVEALFIDTNPAGTDITGDLKTVNVIADSVAEGVDGAAIIERDEVAESRDMTSVESGQSFKVNEELF